MQIDDTWQLFAWSNERLEVTALKFLALLVYNLNIRSFDFHMFAFEYFRSWIVTAVPRSSTVYSALGGRIMALHSCSYLSDSPNIFNYKA